MSEQEREDEHGLDKAAIEREILAGRKFSIAEAIGRLGGEDLLKGASPVSRKRQAEFEMKQALRQHLSDAEGALHVVLLRRITESKTLLESGYESPVRVLGQYVDRLLGSRPALEALVREADAEWGRANDTRPYFEKGTQAAHPEDPYTLESVHAQLTRLSTKLREA